MSFRTDDTLRPFWRKLRDNLDLIERLINRQEQNIANLSNVMKCKYVLHDEIVKTIIEPGLAVAEETMMVSQEIEQFTHGLLSVSCLELGCLIILRTNQALKESAEKSRVKIRELYQRLDESRRFCLDGETDLFGSEIKNNPIEIDFCDWDGLSTEKDLLLALNQLLSEGNKFYIQLCRAYDMPDGYIPPLNKDTII